MSRRTSNQLEWSTSPQYEHYGAIDPYHLPGITLTTVGVVALISTLVAAGFGVMEWSIVGAVVTIALLTTGTSLIALEHERMKITDGWHQVLGRE